MSASTAKRRLRVLTMVDQIEGGGAEVLAGAIARHLDPERFQAILNGEVQARVQETLPERVRVGLGRDQAWADTAEDEPAIRVGLCDVLAYHEDKVNRAFAFTGSPDVGWGIRARAPRSTPDRGHRQGGPGSQAQAAGAAVQPDLLGFPR